MYFFRFFVVMMASLITLSSNPSNAEVEIWKARAHLLQIRYGQELRDLGFLFGRWERLLLECSPSNRGYKAKFYDMLWKASDHTSKELVHDALTAYAQGIMQPLDREPCTEKSAKELGPLLDDRFGKLNATGEELVETYKAQADAMRRRKGEPARYGK